MIDGCQDSTLRDIEFASISELTALYRKSRISPVEATGAVLSRIARLNPRLNAYSLVNGDEALRAARESEKRWREGEARGPLDGVPVSVKDTLMAKGFPFRRGSKATSNEPATENAPIVARVCEQGAVILGITTTPEFGAGPVTISPLTGVTRNPWDTSRNAGGSSGGAAASVVAGMGCAGLATDAGGSIRIPSALCGSVGLKATGGRVPTYPPSVAGPLSCPGPIVRTVRDAALLLSICARPDARDAEALPPADTDYERGLAKGVRNLRIAFSPTLGYAPKVHPDVLDRVATAARVFEGLGATVEEADPGFDNPIGIFLTLFRPGFAYATRNFTEGQLEVIDETLRDVIAAGRKESLFAYLEANDARRMLARTMQCFHEKYDLLVTPTVAVPAFDAERWTPEDFANYEDMRAWTPFAYPFNLSQQPAITVPCGFTGEGLPVGLQIVGPRFADARVLAAAYAYEQARPFEMGRPPLDD